AAAWLALMRPAVHALVGRVVSFAANHRPDDRQLVHYLGHSWQVLANLDARHAGADRFELAANLCRSVRLEVNHILVWWTTRQEDHDNRLVRAAHTGLGLRAQQLRQRQTAHGQAADLQETAPR